MYIQNLDMAATYSVSLNEDGTILLTGMADKGANKVITQSNVDKNQLLLTISQQRTQLLADISGLQASASSLSALETAINVL